jgi:ligand-binding sensor domain-containing protein
VDDYLRALPARWPKRQNEDGDVLPLILPAVRTAAVDRQGRLWIVLTQGVTQVYDETGEKIAAVRFKGADILLPNSLFFTKDGRILVTPGCYEFRVPTF